MKINLVAHEESVKKIYEETKSSSEGLSQKVAEHRLAKDGANELVHAKKASPVLKFLKQFADIMILILLVAGIVSLCFGEYVDGSIILFIVILNAVIGFCQEQKAEKALESLKKMTESQAKVLRGGVITKVNCKDLVIGDIVVLEAGDIVPADLRLFEGAMLKCDESSLTGESEPVLKNPGAVVSKNCALGDRINMAYSSSVVVYGRGLGIVVATGMDTEVGKIATILGDTKTEATPLQNSLKSVGKILTFVVLGVAVVTFLLEFLRGGQSLFNAFMTSVALAVAAIPESLPAVVTIIMALGVSKLAKRRAIVKRLHAVETLGCCEVICSDKTGTLTKNQMTVKRISIGVDVFDELEANKQKSFDILQKIFTLCNDSRKDEKRFVGDPTETALCDFAFGNGFDKQVLDKENSRIFEIPFDSKRKLMSCVCEKGETQTMYLKGGVDEVLSVCSQALINGKVVDLDENLKNKIIEINQSFSNDALRVLAGAYKICQNIDDFDEENLIYVGLEGMIDPPRDDVAEAVAKCQHAGMRAVMITGDHKSTALAIAKQVGIATKSSEVLTGLQIDALDDEEFLKKLQTVCVFARVSPENKVRIVEGFKKLGKVVSMTGDGVNDAPSLKKASIGVGMGITGTDVTKQVADMIVTDDSFSTIVLAVEEGRKIYANIQKTVSFLFTTNVCEVLALLICILAFPSLTFLTPIQILFVNLVSDSLPAIALGVEPAERDVMSRPPRDSKKSLFSGGVGMKICIMAFIQAGLVVGAFLLGKYLGGPQLATTMAFVTINFVEILYMLSARSNNSIFKTAHFKNVWLFVALGACVVLLAIVMFTPLAGILGLVTLGWREWLIVFGLSVSIIPANEAYKYFSGLIIAKKEERK